MNQLSLIDLPTPEPPANVEWYTPAPIIEAARTVMGSIDLDPASCPEANQVVRANQFYTKEAGGLSLPWYGNVWLNPPYARGLIEGFVGRLLSSISGGAVEQAIILTNNCTETAWCQELLSRADAICFPRGRIRFWGPMEHGNSPMQGQAIFYFMRRRVGNLWAHQMQFTHEFESFGKVILR